MRLATFLLITCLTLFVMTAVVWASDAPLSPAVTINATSSGPRVVASTSWTAAIAQAAGAREVDILAPFELRHPPERDFRPSDVTRTHAADFILWAGYEGFMQQLVAAANIPQSRLIQIMTQNDPQHLVALTRELAATWGTTPLQAEWEKEFLAKTEVIWTAAQAQHVSKVRVVSVVHMVPFLSWLGYDIVGTFGFEEMTPVRLHEFSQLNPDLVVDVWHNPTAQPLAEAANAPYVALINFPGHEGTRSLLDVFEFNAKTLGISWSTPKWTVEIHPIEMGTAEITVPSNGLGEPLIEVANRLIGSKTVRVDSDQYVLQVPAGYVEEYRRLFASLIGSPPTPSGTQARATSTETWMVQFAQGTSPLLIDLFHLIFRTETVKQIDALNVHVVRMPPDVDSLRYRYVLLRSPLVVTVEPNAPATIF